MPTTISHHCPLLHHALLRATRRRGDPTWLAAWLLFAALALATGCCVTAREYAMPYTVEAWSDITHDGVLLSMEAQICLAVLLLPACLGGALGPDDGRGARDQLRVTLVRSHDVVLARFAPTVLRLLVAFAATLPVMGAAMWLGAARWDVIVAGAALFATSVALTAALSLYVSTHARRVSAGVASAYGALVFVSVILPLLECALCGMMRRELPVLLRGLAGYEPLLVNGTHCGGWLPFAAASLLAAGLFLVLAARRCNGPPAPSRRVRQEASLDAPNACLRNGPRDSHHGLLHHAPRHWLRGPGVRRTPGRPGADPRGLHGLRPHVPLA